MPKKIITNQICPLANGLVSNTATAANKCEAAIERAISELKPQPDGSVDIINERSIQMLVEFGRNTPGGLFNANAVRYFHANFSRLDVSGVKALYSSLREARSMSFERQMTPHWTLDQARKEILESYMAHLWQTKPETAEAVRDYFEDLRAQLPYESPQSISRPE